MRIAASRTETLADRRGLARNPGRGDRGLRLDPLEQRQCCQWTATTDQLIQLQAGHKLGK